MPIIEQQPLELLKAPRRRPTIYLAGPIQGAPDWQSQAVELIHDLAKDVAGTLIIVNPRREYINDSFDYKKQVAWEKTGLKQAARNGAILFWFAAQDHTLPYEDGRAYAKTTNTEFGRAMGWNDMKPKVQIAMGIEEGYHGHERYFNSCAEKKHLKVHDSLEELCIEAIRKAAYGKL